MDEIIGSQGWNDETVCLLLRRFIAARGLEAAAAEFLQTIADEENEEERTWT